LFDGPGDNVFTGTPGYGTLTGPGYFSTVNNFVTVSAFGGSGTDSAYLFDAQGVGDLFVGTPTYSYFQADHTLRIVSGFGFVRAYASPTGDSQALLFDVGGPLILPVGYDPAPNSWFKSRSDVFRSMPFYSFLEGGNFFNMAVGFAQVNATVGPSVDSVADLYGLGDDFFHGHGTRAMLRRPLST